ncbi:hypothetical protein ACOMHN_055328 [Nucella lapillus]
MTADQPFLSSHHRILLACLLNLVISDVAMAMTSNTWNNLGENTVTSSMATISALRVVSMCVIQCQRMGGCVSVAFDSASDICYLQPTYRTVRQEDVGPPLRVYTIEEVNECKLSEAPDVTNAHVTKWRMTPSSLDADVSCDEDYMLSVDEAPRVRCQLDSGAWTTLMTATCKQFAWRNYTAKVYPVVYSLPRPLSVGLCVRVKGTPTRNNRFNVNLATGGGGDDIVLHVNPRLNSNGVNKTVLNCRQGSWKWSTLVSVDDSPGNPFPFAVGAPFEMVITAVSLYNFTIQVNGVHYTDYRGTLPVTDVVTVYAGDDVSLEYLVIGC